jgi:peroxiredoxin
MFARSTSLLFCAGVLALHLAHASSLIPAKDRKPAPEFALKDANGKLLKISDLRGKVVLLDFWATWCMPCKLEMPWFMEMREKYQNRGFEVIGVSMDDKGWDVVKPFLLETKVTYPVVIGSDALADQYSKLDASLTPGLDMLPSTFILDQQGRVAAFYQGITGKQEFIDAAEALLRETR